MNAPIRALAQRPARAWPTLGVASALALVFVLGWPVPLRLAAQDPTSTPARSIVVTTEILGSIVAELVGVEARVDVIMPAGADPHAYEPSARDAQAMMTADLLVSNGLDLEEGLTSVLEAAAAEGVPWFQATDHIAVRQVDTPAAGAVGTADHDHGGLDPHFWTDPMLMRDVVLALVPALAQEGIDVAAQAQASAAELEALDAEVFDILAVVPADQRKLVTGHESLGYFAARYGFEQIGAVIPGLTTSGEPSARDLAELIATIRDTGTRALFTEVGTPTSVAQAVADDSGVRLVNLSIATLPDGGDYADFMRDLATTIAGALGG
jgi:zinc/manganese transport system substrate-binding protein